MSCDGVAGFGCLASKSCKDNQCQTTACVSEGRRAALRGCAHKASCAGKGQISDGCGGEVDCDKQEGFGCATGKTCNAQRKCVTDTTLPPSTDDTKPDDDETKPADEATQTTGAPIGPAADDDDDGSDRESDTSSSSSKDDKPAAPKKKKTDSGGCSAAPGSSGENAGAALTVFAALAVLSRRRRRD